MAKTTNVRAAIVQQTEWLFQAKGRLGVQKRRLVKRSRRLLGSIARQALGNAATSQTIAPAASPEAERREPLLLPMVNGASGQVMSRPAAPVISGYAIPMVHAWSHGQGRQRQPSTAPARDWARELAPSDGRHLKVLMDVSNKCNLRCVMCFFSYDSVFYRAPDYISPALFTRIADQFFARAHTVVLSAGAEPLTSPHFAEVLEIAARYKVPHLKFLTNAQLFTPEIIDAVMESGVTEIDVSIDGATKPTYDKIRRGGTFERLYDNLSAITERKRALGVNIPALHFNVTLMRSNIDELHEFVPLAERLGVETIGCRHVLPYTGLGMEPESLQHDKAHANAQLQRFLTAVSASPNLNVVTFPDFFTLEEGSDEAPPAAEAVAVPAVATPEHAASADSAPAEVVPGGPPAATVAPGPVPLGAAAPATSEAARPASADQQPRRKPWVGPRVGPFGSVGLPPAEREADGDTVLFAGWALDSDGPVRVMLERLPESDDPSESINQWGMVDLVEAKFINGSRPDVALKYPEFEHNYAAGWTAQLSKEMVPPSIASECLVYVIVYGADGTRVGLNTRTVRFTTDGSGRPFLFCPKPFESVYINSNGDVNPYPDCRPDHPFGSSVHQDFEEIWYGREFMELRQSIIDRDPPSMCIQCPEFINRNVDDKVFFTEFAAEPAYRRAIGSVGATAITDDRVTLDGWALCLDEIESLTVWSETPDSQNGGEPVRQKVGAAAFLDTPPCDEVQAVKYRRYPCRDRSNWHFEADRRQLPGDGRGVSLQVVARNAATGVDTMIGVVDLV